MDKNPYIEFREDDEAPGGIIKVYFLGVHVQTITDTNTQPGGWTYISKEQASKRADLAIKHLWNQVGKATPETKEAL